VVVESGFDTPNGTRGARQPRGRLLKVANKLVMSRIRRKGSGPQLVLTTIGRKSGASRQSPLRWFPGPEGSWVVVASAGGAAANPAWYYNLGAHPDQVTIEVEGRTVPVTATQMEDPERAEMWQQIVAAAGQFADYQRKTDRRLPVIRLTERAVRPT
jgi:deazaflavin-dependent oxidoreductase (nitroreductase family)